VRHIAAAAVAENAPIAAADGGCALGGEGGDDAGHAGIQRSGDARIIISGIEYIHDRRVVISPASTPAISVPSSCTTSTASASVRSSSKKA
jgi:hypothetical protein